MSVRIEASAGTPRGGETNRPALSSAVGEGRTVGRDQGALLVRFGSVEVHAVHMRHAIGFGSHGLWIGSPLVLYVSTRSAIPRLTTPLERLAS